MKNQKPADPDAWKAAPETERRIDEIAERYLDLLQAGGTPDRQALVASHPDIAGLLDRRLALVELMFEARPPERRPGGVPPTRPREETRERAAPRTPDPAETIDLEGPEANPERIGPYKILDSLGKGGMGVVYLADQQEPVRRRVALKLIKLGMDTKDVVARFESERQALALMNHPGIARVYEAGSTAVGRPYFAMEHVPGLPITDYCDRNRLSTTDRLGLFGQVCDAVQHAHQKGVIHRDLKPSNILVTIPNGKPVPKIIDFGVAKATNQRLAEHTVYTERGRIIGTPEYMSPEQADITSVDVDTRSDIYSLGVVLYELLVGTLPFNTQALRAGGLDEIRRRIREEEPPKPSTRISTLGEYSAAVAQRRRTDPSSLCRLVRGDLDWITMRAMEKDRTRRYATASELGADIARHLRDEPVLAGPPSASYRLKKFVRKHRGSVLATALVGGAILLGLAMSTSLYFQKKRESDKSRAVTKFFTDDLLGSFKPEERGRKVTLEEVLDEASERITKSPPPDAWVEAEVRFVIGYTYRNLGIYDKAEPHLRAALEIRRREMGDGHQETRNARVTLARLLQRRGKPEAAEDLLRENLRIERARFGEHHEETLWTMDYLASALKDQGRLPEAEKMARRVLEAWRRDRGPETEEILWSTQAVARLCTAQDKLDEAEELYREALKLAKRIRGADHTETLAAKNNLARLLLKQERASEAKVLLREVLDVYRVGLGEDHPNALSTRNNLADALRMQGELEEAERIFREVLAARREVLGPGHPQTLLSMHNLAWVIVERGESKEAGGLLRDAMEASRREGRESFLTLILTDGYARFLNRVGRPEEAEPLLAEVIETAETNRSLGDLDLAICRSNYGRTLTLLGRYEEAEEILTSAYKTIETKLGRDRRLAQRIREYLVRLYEAWGRPEAAEAYRAIEPPPEHAPR